MALPMDKHTGAGFQSSLPSLYKFAPVFLVDKVGSALLHRHYRVFQMLSHLFCLPLELTKYVFVLQNSGHQSLTFVHLPLTTLHKPIPLADDNICSMQALHIHHLHLPNHQLKKKSRTNPYLIRDYICR